MFEIRPEREAGGIGAHGVNASTIGENVAGLNNVQVVTTATSDGVDAGAAGEGVVKAIACQTGAPCTGYDTRLDIGRQGVVGQICFDRIGTAGIGAIGKGFGGDIADVIDNIGVVSGAAYQAICPRAAVETVVAIHTKQGVVQGIADQRVIAGTTCYIKLDTNTHLDLHGQRDSAFGVGVGHITVCGCPLDPGFGNVNNVA